MRHSRRTATNAFVRVSITNSVWTRRKEQIEKVRGERIGEKGVGKIERSNTSVLNRSSNENEADQASGMIAPHSGQSSQLLLSQDRELD